MQYFFKKKKGFTLIELLVVVAIVGILVSIIAVNVNSTRTKAKNNAIISSMNSLREGGEMYANINGTYAGFCGTNCTTGGSDWQTVCKSVQAKGGNLACNNSATAWAASSPLIGGAVYCVDSTNQAGNTAPGAGVYACP